MLDIKQIRVIFLFGFKMGHKAAETTHNINNTFARPPDLCLEKFVCRSGSNSENWTWNNRLVPNRKRSTSRLHMVTLLI